MLSTDSPALFRECARFFAQVFDFFPPSVLDDFADEPFLTPCVAFICNVPDDRNLSVCALLGQIARSSATLQSRIHTHFSLQEQFNLLRTAPVDPIWNRGILELISSCCHFEIPGDVAGVLVRSLCDVVGDDFGVYPTLLATTIFATCAQADEALDVFCACNFCGFADVVFCRHSQKKWANRLEEKAVRDTVANVLSVAISLWDKFHQLLVPPLPVPELAGDRAAEIAIQAIDLCSRFVDAEPDAFFETMETARLCASLTQNIRFRSALVKSRSADLLARVMPGASQGEVVYVLQSFVLPALLDLFELSDGGLRVHLLELLYGLIQAGEQWGQQDVMLFQFRQDGVAETLWALAQSEDDEIAQFAQVVIGKIDLGDEDQELAGDPMRAEVLRELDATSLWAGEGLEWGPE
jgi:hypothetical protein